MYLSILPSFICSWADPQYILLVQDQGMKFQRQIVTKRHSETKTEMKKNLEEVTFRALAPTIMHSSVYCFPFHTHLSNG